MNDWDIIPPPATMTVEHKYRPVLYTADGKVLVRQAGFRSETTHDLPRVSSTSREISGARRASEGGSRS